MLASSYDPSSFFVKCQSTSPQPSPGEERNSILKFNFPISLSFFFSLCTYRRWPLTRTISSVHCKHSGWWSTGKENILYWKNRWVCHFNFHQKWPSSTELSLSADCCRRKTSIKCSSIWKNFWTARLRLIFFYLFPMQFPVPIVFVLNRRASIH